MTAVDPDDRRPPGVELADPDAEPATPAAFASWLRGQRAVRGLSREEVARTTKLAPTVVAALESGDPDRMPARAYLYGYLKTYAGALGLDADEVVLRWQEVELAETPADPEPEPARRGLVLGTGSRLPLVAALGVVAAGAAAAAWLLG